MAASVVTGRIVPVALVALAVALPFFAQTYYLQFASKVLLMGLLAMALNLVVGFGGLVSLCHAALFGLAGYVLALTGPQYEAASIWLTLPAAVGAAALAALVIGALSLRTRGIYFIMVTLAFGEMLFFFFHDTRVAGGSDGTFIYQKPEVAVAGWRLLDLEKAPVFYWVVLGFTLAGIALLHTILRSPFGHALAAARVNERRARSLGFPIYPIRLAAFVISGALAGLSGYFAVAQFGYVAPQMLGWHLSATALVMVVLGGMGTVTGPLLGAAILMGLEEFLRASTEHWKLLEGLIIIGLVLAFPHGVRQLFAMILTPHAWPMPRRAREPAATAREAGHA
jgi:branched-chain amino acid transport system permease protein